MRNLGRLFFVFGFIGLMGSTALANQVKFFCVEPFSADEFQRSVEREINNLNSGLGPVEVIDIQAAIGGGSRPQTHCATIKYKMKKKE